MHDFCILIQFTSKKKSIVLRLQRHEVFLLFVTWSRAAGGAQWGQEPMEMDGKGDRICVFPLKATPAGRLVVELLEVPQGKNSFTNGHQVPLFYNINSQKGKGPRA